MTTIFLVWGYDVGGNTGPIVMAAFKDEAEADKFASESREREWNNAFGPDKGAPFDVQEEPMWDTYEEFKLATASREE